MKNTIYPSTDFKKNIAGVSFHRCIPWLLLCLFFALITPRLSACAMSAVYAMPGYTLSNFQPSGEARDYKAYDDPWDYLGFVMANSSAVTNEDGYGVVAYASNDPLLTPRRTWYKRIREASDFGHLYYTGQYLNQADVQDVWAYDTLDNALFLLMSGEVEASMVMCHARNATGITYGNHPFTFESVGRTFSFMHNGNVNFARSYMINQIDMMNPHTNWFYQHPSNYFNQTNPYLWVDSEVLFHYIMSHIINSQGNVLFGLNKALAGIRQYTGNPHSGVYNFLMSDGSNLYVYRSSPLTGAYSNYKLSYKQVRNGFYGVRTQSPQEGDIELGSHELVVFSSQQIPRRYPNFSASIYQNFSVQEEMVLTRAKPMPSVSTIACNPNPFKASTTFRITMNSPNRLNLKIYNTKGETVWQTVQDIGNPGIINLPWNGMDISGNAVATGLYFYRVEIGEQTHTGRIIRIK